MALVAFALLHFHVFGGDDPTVADPSATSTVNKTGKAQTTQGGPSTHSPSAIATSPTATATSPSVSPSPKPSPKPSVSPSPKPTPKPSAPSPKPSGTKAPPPPAPVAAPHYPLLVLNNSSVSGLGTAAAGDFEAGGWTIAGVGNLTGRLKDTTVYYSPGYEASARAFAAQFPQVHRVLARIPGLPGSAKLTVVVTRYYEPGK